MSQKKGLCKGLGWRSEEFKRGKGMKNKRKKKKRLAMEAERHAAMLKRWEEESRLENMYDDIDKW